MDDIIIFHSLAEKDLTRIVDIQLQRLEKRLTQQQLTLEMDRSAKQLIAKEGYDPQFGARPLKRAIQDRLLDPLATKLLLGEFKPGDRIKVAAHDGELEFPNLLRLGLRAVRAFRQRSRIGCRRCDGFGNLRCTPARTPFCILPPSWKNDGCISVPVHPSASSH